MRKPRDYKEGYERIIEARESLGYTKKSLTELFKVGVNTIGIIEKRGRIPRLWFLDLYEKHLGIPLDELAPLFGYSKEEIEDYKNIEKDPVKTDKLVLPTQCLPETKSSSYYVIGFPLQGDYDKGVQYIHDEYLNLLKFKTIEDAYKHLKARSITAEEMLETKIFVKEINN